jgi:hypothetical protein
VDHGWLLSLLRQDAFVPPQSILFPFFEKKKKKKKGGGVGGRKVEGKGRRRGEKKLERRGKGNGYPLSLFKCFKN